MIGLTAILKEAWNTAQQTEDGREKIQALSLAKECYSMKLDLLTNASVVDDAIKFVSNHNNNNSDNEKQKHISNHQAKEEESTTTTEETTNRVF
jgi:hypothetical protein